MIGDQDKFICVKRKGGNVAFGDDSSAKIIGKCVVELGRKNVKEKNVLLVEYLKHNLVSVSKMCDQGYTLTFVSQRCKIKEEGSGILVATTIGRPSNIYILNSRKISKGERDYKNEVLLSAIYSGGAAPPFSIDVKGGDKMGS
jgi:hypothetical protein